MISVSCVGLMTPGFYARETLNWQAQSVGQDFMDAILLTPVLLVSAFLAYRGSRFARLVWAGANLYLAYTFVIFCFSIHFNILFPLYTLILGLSIYSLVYFFYKIMTERPSPMQVSPGRFTGFYFIAVAVIFYFLWLSEILGSILQNRIPPTLLDTGLVTNPVQALDLSIILPAFFISGILILRNHWLGSVMAPVMLTFASLMNITIAGLMVFLQSYGLEANWIVAGVMIVLAILNIWLLKSRLKVYSTSQYSHAFQF